MWVLREKTLGEEVRSEALISTSTDGRVLQVMAPSYDSTLLRAWCLLSPSLSLPLPITPSLPLPISLSLPLSPSLSLSLSLSLPLCPPPPAYVTVVYS